MIAAWRKATRMSEGVDYAVYRPTVAFTLEVNMEGQSRYKVLSVADGYADKGYAVYIDGACYRNCSGV